MKKLKILILNTTNKEVPRELLNETKKYYAEEAPKAFGIPPVQLDFAENFVKDVSIYEIIDWNEHFNSAGVGYFNLNEQKLFSRVKQELGGNEYDIVIWYYKAPWSILKYLRNAWFLPSTHLSPVRNGTFVIEMTEKLVDKHQWKHEIAHALRNVLARKAGKSLPDNMDTQEAIINGVKRKTSYYKNNEPLAKDGNYSIHFKALKDYYDLLEKPAKTIAIKKGKIIPEMITSPLGYRIPKNFSLNEVMPRHIIDKYGEKSWEFIDIRILENIQAIRQYYKRAIYINNRKKGLEYRGYDDGSYRGISSKSQHRFGRALDFTVSGYSAEQVRQDLLNGLAERLPHPDISIEDRVAWNHMDIRNHKGGSGVWRFNP